MKYYSHNGLAGCVEQRTTRSGIRVGLYHSEQAGIEDDPSCRWATVCEEHGTLVCHESLRAAKSWLSHPEDFCELCAENAQ